MTLSRLHDELFLKDTRYACDYWEEHESNFKAMVNELLIEETLLKILNAGKETSLMFNERIKAFSNDENEKLIRVAYERLETLIQPVIDFTGKENKESFNGKKFLLDGMSDYFKVLTQAKEEKGKALSDVFISKKDILQSFFEPLCPEGFSLEQMCSLFAPQLLIYFSYLLWKYDQAMEGKLVRDYFKDFDEQRERISSPENVEKIWAEVYSRPDTKDTFEIEPEPESESEGKGGQKNEAWIFQASAMRQRDAIEGYWTRRGTEIRELYNQKSNSEKEEFLTEIRQIIGTIGNGIYKDAIIYCPELYPAKLAGIDKTKTPYGIFSFEDLVEFIRKFKELPKISPKNTQEIINLLKEESFGDPFIHTISKRLGSSQKLLPLVALSRHHLLFVFCHITIAKLLDIPLSSITDGLPGCSAEDADIPINIPLSTREQRESTPIGKPPVPGLVKKSNPSKPQPKIEEVKEEIEEINADEIPEESNSIIRCSEPSCGKIQSDDKKFQVCSFCKKFNVSIPYCSKECQIKHWRSTHKHHCYRNKN